MGHTASAIEHAPKNSIYVWGTMDTYYPRQLATYLNREDLTIVGPEFMTRTVLGGLRCNVVIDHAAKLSDTQVQALYDHTVKLAFYGKLRACETVHS